MENILKEDLDHILEHTRGLWEEVRGERIFITGGTGFFGCWLLESFAWANARLNLNASAVVLSRNPEAFGRKAPHLFSNPAIQFHTGDVRSFKFPEGTFSHIIHAAKGADSLNPEDPLLLFEGMVKGTRHMSEFARHCSAKKLLFTSSGAVYGKQPQELTHIGEDYAGAPDTMTSASAYGEGKRVSEFLTAAYASRYGFEAKIARCFAFVGPHLPLDINFAIGNFIDNVLKNEQILIRGDGTPCRSYLYACSIWPYGFGPFSSEALPAAHTMSARTTGLPLRILQGPWLMLHKQNNRCRCYKKLLQAGRPNAMSRLSREGQA